MKSTQLRRRRRRRDQQSHTATAIWLAGCDRAVVEAFIQVATDLGETEFSDILWRYLRLAPDHEGPLVELAEHCLRPMMRRPGAGSVLTRIADKMDHEGERGLQFLAKPSHGR